MNFESRITKTSATPGMEGVAFTLNKMTEGRRSKLRLATADIYIDLQGLLEQARALSDTDRLAAIRLFTQADNLTAARLKPAVVRWGLHKLDGLVIDGKPATADTLIEDGPEGCQALYEEIYNAIQDEAGLTDKQQGESALPSISGALEDGQKSISSVPLADVTATT